MFRASTIRLLLNDGDRDRTAWPPVIVINDLKSYRAEDVPEEFLTALAKELNWQP